MKKKNWIKYNHMLLIYIALICKCKIMYTHVRRDKVDQCCGQSSHIAVIKIGCRKTVFVNWGSILWSLVVDRFLAQPKVRTHRAVLMILPCWKLENPEVLSEFMQRALNIVLLGAGLWNSHSSWDKTCALHQEERREQFVELVLLNRILHPIT